MTTENTGSGLSRRGDSVETHIPGSPEAFHALASYLRDILGSRVEDLGDEVAGRRSALSASWRGQAGEAFGVRAANLVTASDLVLPRLLASANEIDALGDMLRAVQEGMTAVRSTAAAAGLAVAGTQVLKPVRPLNPGEAIPSIFDRTPEEVAKDTAFVKAAETADAHWQRWYDRINDAGGFIANYAADLVGYFSNLVATAASKGLTATASSILTKQATWLREQSAQSGQHAADLTDYIAKTGDESVIYRHDTLVDESIKARYASEAAEAAAKDPPLPTALRGGLGGLTALATGAGIYADIHEGESATQAAVSQTGAMVAGGAAAYGTGLAIGSTFGPAGSIGGVIAVGSAELAVGTAVAIGIDDVIDAVFDDDDEAEVDPPSPTEQYGAELLDYAGQVTASEEQ